jgi:hypothetical protein
MATRKAGSRRIVVDETVYRWRIRRRAAFNQTDYGVGLIHVAVERAEAPGATLIIRTDRPHPADYTTTTVVPVLPSDVAQWIRQAIAAGWSPGVPGPTFCGQLEGGECVREVRIRWQVDW